MRILIVSGGKLDIAYTKTFLSSQQFDHIIAADSGLKHCDCLSILPTEILGDFDSLKEQELLEEYQKKGIPVKTFPTRKDFTDTELAIHYALDLLENKEGEVVIVAATGSRLDHTMANIGLLELFTERNIVATIEDAHNSVRMIQGPCELMIERRKDRPFLSLIACDHHVKGLILSGVSYPLKNASLPMYVSLGISNEITEDCAKLKLESGTVLIMETRD